MLIEVRNSLRKLSSALNYMYEDEIGYKKEMANYNIAWLEKGGSRRLRVEW